MQTTRADALAVLEKFKIPVSPAILDYLLTGHGETPKPGNPAFAGDIARLVATPQMALEGCRCACSRTRLAGLYPVGCHRG